MSVPEERTGSAASVLLINPSLSPESVPPVMTGVLRDSVPFSLGHLAGYLLEKGHQVRVVDDQLERLDAARLERIIASLAPPRVVGITVLTVTCARAYELARIVKTLDPAATVVLGGVHATALPEEGLRRPGVDVVVRGEGELTLEELVRHVGEGSSWAGITGISVLEGGLVRHNPPRPLLEDLDTLPPFPYHLFEADRERYRGFAAVITSRGCPHRCAFCSQRDSRYRSVSVERALDDIGLLVNRYGATSILSYDDTIGADRERLLRLTRRIRELGYDRKTSFQALIRADNLDAELLGELKAANFTLLIVGIETASNTLMRLINKGTTVEKISRSIRLAADQGIDVAATVIFGLPGETGADRAAARRLVASLPLASVRFNLFTPYPGTLLYETLSQSGEVHVAPDWVNFSPQYFWSGDDLAYVPRDTSRDELMLAIMAANLWYYLRPAGLRRLFTKRFAGAVSVPLPAGWYRTRQLGKILLLGGFFARRFIAVLSRVVARRIAGRVWNRCG